MSAVEPGVRVVGPTVAEQVVFVRRQVAHFLQRIRLLLACQKINFKGTVEEDFVPTVAISLSNRLLACKNEP